MHPAGRDHGKPRFDGLPLIVISTTGGAHGSLTLRIGEAVASAATSRSISDTNVDGVVDIGDRVTFQDRIRLQPGAAPSGSGTGHRCATRPS